MRLGPRASVALAVLIATTQVVGTAFAQHLCRCPTDDAPPAAAASGGHDCCPGMAEAADRPSVPCDGLGTRCCDATVTGSQAPAPQADGPLVPPAASALALTRGVLAVGPALDDRSSIPRVRWARPPPLGSPTDGVVLLL